MIGMMPLLRMLGALSIVLGLLSGALWAFRRLGIRMPGAVGVRGSGRRIELVERVGLDGKRCLALIRRDGREHLLLLGPDGPLVIEAGIVRDELDVAAARAIADEADARRAVQAEAIAALQAKADRIIARVRDAHTGGGASFTTLVDRARASSSAGLAAPPIATASALFAAKSRPQKAA